MILFANFLIAVAKVIHFLLMLYIWIIIIRVILTWIQVPSLYTVSSLLYGLTEPVMRPVRRFVPPYKLGGFDISPMIVVVLIMFADTFLVNSLSLYAKQMLIGPEVSF